MSAATGGCKLRDGSGDLSDESVSDFELLPVLFFGGGSVRLCIRLYTVFTSPGRSTARNLLYTAVCDSEEMWHGSFECIGRVKYAGADAQAAEQQR
jgi:hypothetical protein